MFIESSMEMFMFDRILMAQLECIHSFAAQFTIEGK